MQLYALAAEGPPAKCTSIRLDGTTGTILRHRNLRASQSPTPTPVKERRDLLAEQALYYRQRASEYDDWWFRRGRYDEGPDRNIQWRSEVSEVQNALERFEPAGNILEFACGTGLWTERLHLGASHMTVVDSSPEMIALCRARLGATKVEFIEQDLFGWEPEKRYDMCFFGFWLSHVPDSHFDRFWAKVYRALEPGGRVFFVDSQPEETRFGRVDTFKDSGNETLRRRLADGREFRIVKHFFEPTELRRRLAGLGWSLSISATETFFIYGHAKPQAHRNKGQPVDR